jgi:hypothetical protein
MADIFSIAENLSDINPTQLLQSILSRADIQRLMIDLNTHRQLGELNENAFGIKLASIGGDYSKKYAKSKGVAPSWIDLEDTGRYWQTFKIIPLANGNAEIISDNTIHGADTFLANERWGEVEGLNEENTLIIKKAVNEAIAEIILSFYS